MFRECSKCKKAFESRPSDTLLYHESFDKKDIGAQYEQYLKTAAFDPTTPREFYPCPTCKAPITGYCILGDEMKFVRVCVCGARF
jgi:hypothetical protein